MVRVAALEVEQNQNVGSIETLGGQLRRLQSDAAAADGRTVEQAEEEIAEAEKMFRESYLDRQVAFGTARLAPAPYRPAGWLLTVDGAPAAA